MAEFNSEGWVRFWRRTAGLLRRNSVKGVIGNSWFYDPSLDKISPHLTYLRSLVMKHGGFSFRAGTRPGTVDSATRTSKTRRHFYETGKYVPVDYTVVWLRKDILAWDKTYEIG